MAQIEREGSISYYCRYSPIIEGIWRLLDCDQRLICVNVTPQRSEGELIGSILFENA